jgi:hypothetical protein
LPPKFRPVSFVSVDRLDGISPLMALPFKYSFVSSFSMDRLDGRVPLMVLLYNHTSVMWLLAQVT